MSLRRMSRLVVSIVVGCYRFTFLVLVLAWMPHHGGQGSMKLRKRLNSWGSVCYKFALWVDFIELQYIALLNLRLILLLLYMSDTSERMKHEDFLVIAAM